MWMWIRLLVGVALTLAFRIPVGDAEAPRILLVCSGSCPYGNLQAAVEAARPYDVVRLWAGRYPGVVLIDKPLVLEGEGSENTVLEGWIGILGTQDVTVRALRVQSGSVRIRKGQGIKLEGVEVSGSPIAGIRIEESQDVALEHVAARGSRGPGVEVENGLDVRIREGVFERNAEDGIRVRGVGGAELWDNLLRGNRGCALRAEGASQVSGEGNRDVDNANSGADCVPARPPASDVVRVGFLDAPPEGVRSYVGVAGQTTRVRLRIERRLRGGLLLSIEPLPVRVTFYLSPDPDIGPEDRKLGREESELAGPKTDLEAMFSLPADLFHQGLFVTWRPAYLGAVVEGDGVRSGAVRPGFLLPTGVRAGFPHEVRAVAFSPDGAVVAAGGCARRTEAQGCVTGEIRLLSPTGLKPLRVWEAHAGPVHSLAFSPDGELLASASADGVLVWEVATGRRIYALPPPDPDGAVGIEAVAFHPNGQLLAAGAEDGSVLLWDRFTGQLIGRWRAHPEAVFSLAFSPDGRWLATGSRDASVKIWEALSGRLVHALRGRLGWILAVAFSPDGRWLALGSRDGSVRLWDWQAAATDPNSPTAVRTLGTHSGWVRSVLFHPEGRGLVSAADDGTILLWSLTGGVVRALRGHLSGVEALAFSPDGELLASGSRDRTVRFWSGF